jgi:hypothetical protein
MKVTYQIFKIIDKEVCVPSEDHYARDNDWCKEDIQILYLVHKEDSLEEAVAYLKELKKELEEEIYGWGSVKKICDYTILPVYTF